MEKIIKIYHGSTMAVVAPRILPLSRRLDFGAGFYTTSSRWQAQRWAQIKRRRIQAEMSIVSTYSVAHDFDTLDLKVKEFKSADSEWLDFVVQFRMGQAQTAGQYDLVIGPVANDTLYETLLLFERGILTHAETIARLKTQELADQIVFVTEKSLSVLNFESSEVVDNG